VLPFTVAEEAGIWLSSDQHIGASNVDYELIRDELAEAGRNGDRINLNGDVFDCILPKDHRRFRPDTLHPHLQGRSDVLDAALEMAEDIYGPYAELIDMIGLGNHESAVEKYHATDMIARLARRLNQRGGKVSYGGYTGFIDYRFRAKGGRASRYIVYYHHGSGGSAPATKGITGFGRRMWVDSDVIWLGHQHNKLVDGTTLKMSCPREGDDPIMRKQVGIMTGGYMNSYEGQTQADVRSGGRRGHYAEDAGLPPQAKGGARLTIKFDRRCGIKSARVTM